MQEKILVICASRGRPKELGRMIDSFISTAKMSSLSVCLDNDDPCLDEYREVIGSKCPYIIDFRKTTTEIINNRWKYCSDNFRYFSVTNDDFIYHTDSWDLKLVNAIKINGGIGIAYGNDLLAGVHLPTTSIISREIVEALGWLQLPGLTHLYGDQVWKVIGAGAKCLHYRDYVIIEHCHVFGKKMQSDETHKITNSPSMYIKDEKVFNKWLESQSQIDIKKVKKCLNTTLVNG